MSERQWAAIIYGRSYHLDFRFITVPHNFTPQDIHWASDHIVATTQQARNLPGSPRWSLFKNDTYCVVGVTCMVRDLISPLRKDFLQITKDDQGRPLFVFVGYVTQLEQSQLDNFPPYQGNNLENFQALSQDLLQVWLVKNYEEQRKKTRLSQYQALSFAESAIAVAKQQLSPLNHQFKSPEQTYLWSSAEQYNAALWLAAAHCTEATSLCVNITGKALNNSPFLNQSCSQIEKFQIKERVTTISASNLHDLNPHPHRFSLPHKISQRAQSDIDLTLHQAAKIATASQELLNNFTDWFPQEVIDSESVTSESDDSGNEAESYGFKTKKSSSVNNQDWF